MSDTKTLNMRAQQEMFNFLFKQKGIIQKLTRSVLLEVGNRLIERSPIGYPPFWQNKHWPAGYNPGSFINNWQLGKDSVPQGTIQGQDATGLSSRARMKAAIPQWPVGHIYYFVNNLPYAMALEEGHSRQAPQGMVRLTQMEFPQIMRQAETNYSRDN